MVWLTDGKFSEEYFNYLEAKEKADKRPPKQITMASSKSVRISEEILSKSE